MPPGLPIEQRNQQQQLLRDEMIQRRRVPIQRDGLRESAPLLGSTRSVGTNNSGRISAKSGASRWTTKSAQVLKSPMRFFGRKMRRQSPPPRVQREENRLAIETEEESSLSSQKNDIFGRNNDKNNNILFVPKSPSPSPSSPSWDKDDDIRSFASSISSLISNDDNMSISSQLSYKRSTGLKRLMRKFAMRDKILRKFGENNGQTYLDMLVVNEQAVRSKEIDDFNKNFVNSKNSNNQKPGNKTGGDVYVSLEPPPEGKGPSWLNWVKSIFLFECLHGIPIVLLMPIYTLGHHAFYDLIATFLELVASLTSPFINTDVFYLSVIVAGSITLRWTGMLWAWSDDTRKACVKFEFHNRLRLGYMEARVVRFFKHRGTLLTLVCMVNFYLVYASVSYFYYHRGYALIETMIDEWNNSSTFFQDDASVTSLERFNLEKFVVTDECYMIQKHSAGVRQRTFGTFWCNIDGESISVFVGYSLIICVVSAQFLYLIGFRFMGTFE